VESDRIGLFRSFVTFGWQVNCECDPGFEITKELLNSDDQLKTIGGIFIVCISFTFT